MIETEWTYRDFRKDVLDRIKRNKDCLIAGVGDRGAGKSTDTFQIGWDLDRKFDHTRMVFSGRVLWVLLGSRVQFPPGTVFVFDEAVLALFKHDWNTKESKDLVRVINIVRERRYIVIMNIPHWGSLNPEVKKHFHWVIDFRDSGNDEFNYGHFHKRGPLRQFSKKPPAFPPKGDGVKFWNEPHWKSRAMRDEFLAYVEEKGGTVDRYGQDETVPEDIELAELPDAIKKIRQVCQEDGIPTI